MGPLALFPSLAGPWGWILANWRVILFAVLFLGYTGWVGKTFYGLGSNRAEYVCQRETMKRDAEDALVEAEHKRVVKELDDAADAVSDTHTKKEQEYGERAKKPKKELIGYVASHSAAGVDPHDIGDDGVRLINDAIEARRAVREGEGKCEGPGELCGTVKVKLKRIRISGSLGP